MAAAGMEERRQALLVELLSAQPRVLRYCRSRLQREQDAQDACQEAYVLVLRRIDDLLEHENPIGWVFVTARNKCLELLRQREREPQAQVAGMPEGRSEDVLDMLIARGAAREMLARLSPQDRRIVELKLDGYSAREIGLRLGLTENAVNLRMYRIRQRWDEAAS